MFIMKKFMLPFKVAATIVKERREKIDMNYGFVKQLCELEEAGFKFPIDFSDRCSESTEGEENLISGNDGCTLKIQTTNAQELYNHYQYFKNDQILVIDFR